MREAFVHEAVLEMAPDGDLRAPGAAITVALCGAWEHPPPCPLAPHHSDARRVGDEVHVRTLFAAAPGAEQRVRDAIDRALAGGRLRCPDGTVERWRLRGGQRGTLTADEADHARRLARQ